MTNSCRLSFYNSDNNIFTHHFRTNVAVLMEKYVFLQFDLYSERKKD